VASTIVMTPSMLVRVIRLDCQREEKRQGSGIQGHEVDSRPSSKNLPGSSSEVLRWVVGRKEKRESDYFIDVFINALLLLLLVFQNNVDFRSRQRKIPKNRVRIMCLSCLSRSMTKYTSRSVLLPLVKKTPDLMVESWQVSWDRKIEVHVSGGYSYDAT
jgi:hypothetical protein